MLLVKIDTTSQMRYPACLAILIPCRNEASTIGKVIADFRRALPDAAIWVCDNGSHDDTAARAHAAGAQVLSEPRAGKGNAVRALFTVADADALLLVDGDDTYDAGSAQAMLTMLAGEHCEMVVARRVTQQAGAQDAYRRGHEWGNRMFAASISQLFGHRVDDVFSGYRAFTRRFVRSFPAASRGFEIETELTVHALDLGLRIREMRRRIARDPTARRASSIRCATAAASRSPCCTFMSRRTRRVSSGWWVLRPRCCRWRSACR